MAMRPDARDGVTPPMPPRPAMSDLTPPPRRGIATPTAGIRVTRGLWFASFAVGVAAILYAFVFRDAQLAQLTAVLTNQQPNLTDEQLKTAATTAFLVSLSVLGALVVIEAILLRVLMAGYGAVRWGQLAVFLLHAAAALVATAVIALGTGGVLAIAFVLTQLVSAGAALVASILPSSWAWLRGEREARRGRRASV